MLSLGRLSRSCSSTRSTIPQLQQRHKHAVRDFGYDITKGVEPVWDSETGKLHYEHYLSLVNRLNRALTNTEHEDLNASQVLLRVSDRHPLHDLAAEIVNHETMWSSVCPGGKPPSERMKQILNIQFGGLQNFISQWIGKGNSINGCGWMWLVADYTQLEVTMSFNAGTPKPPVVGLMAMDVWEHAYFPVCEGFFSCADSRKQYRSNRRAYIVKWLQAVDWEYIEKAFDTLYDREARYEDIEFPPEAEELIQKWASGDPKFDLEEITKTEGGDPKKEYEAKFNNLKQELTGQKPLEALTPGTPEHFEELLVKLRQVPEFSPEVEADLRKNLRDPKELSPGKVAQLVGAKVKDAEDKQRK